MAVSRIYRVFVFALKASAQEVLTEIQGLASVHLEDAHRVVEELEGETQAPQASPASRKLAQVESALAALRPHEKRPSLLERLRSERPTYRFEDLTQLEEKPASERIAGEVNGITDEDAKLSREADVLEGQLAALEPWKDVPDSILSVIRPTETTVAFFVKMPREALGEMERYADDVAWELFAERENDAYVIAVLWRDSADEMKQKLTDLSAEIMSLPEVDRTPAEESERITSRLEEVRCQRSRLEARLRELASDPESLQASRDCLAMSVAREQVGRLMSNTELVAVLVGYIPEHRRDELAERLERFGSAAQVVFEETGQEEDTPVLLRNNRAVAPFEVVTNIFGLPRSREFDPTPMLTPFFALFFAIALTDAGYGLVLVVVSLLAKRFLRLSRAVDGFMTLLLIAGLATIVLGVLTGGYFGIQTESLPPLLQSLIVINPMADPISFLYFTLVLGCLQLWFGMMVSFYKHWSRDGIVAAVCLDLPWMLLLPSAVLAVAGGQAYGRYGLYGMLLAAIMIVLLNGYENRNVLKRIGVGLYALYGATSLLGDVLSYSRLMAFGLATAGIGMVVNLLSKMLADSIPVIGVPLMVVLLIFGHLFNLVINAFGGWVHTARLQFIEFFGRFYEGGGRPFEPFHPRTKYVDIKAPEGI